MNSISNSETIPVNVDENDETNVDTGIDILEVLPGFSSFDDFINAGFDALKNGIKTANSFPNGQKYDYYACFPNFRNIVNGEIENVLDCMQSIVNSVGVTGDIKRRDMEEKFELLVEANDILLERAGICMDEASGILRNPEVELVVSQSNTPAVSGSWNKITSSIDGRSDQTSNNQGIRLLTAKNIQRPQLTFRVKIDNSNKPWCPIIQDKPNSLKPLALFMEEDDNGEFFSHPYEFELDRFQPPESQMLYSEPIKYKSLDDTPLIVIERSEDIKILLNDLRNYDEIAIDLEHHSYRSYQGITCLMQISTRNTDYVIDTLSLRSDLQELNEIFTKSSVLKVFHGALHDIQWLQRDLGLYIVNMFDTNIAAKQLNLPYLSLAYLLKQYCGVDPNKHFQLADWRVRPLPEELLKYAREDTHYLLYIKDKLKNALLEQSNGQSNILRAVYSRSTEICKTIYRKPVWTEESCMSIYRKSKKMFNNKQLYALRELHKWRDITGREEDDSTGYVLPNHMLLNIAESLPREMQGILACCNPIPPLVRQNLLHLHKIILKARDQPIIKPVLEEDIRQRMTQRNQTSDIENTLLYYPHDMPKGMDVRADLPCLLDSANCAETSQSSNIEQHHITVFDTFNQSKDKNSNGNNSSSQKQRAYFISPFERYKRVLPMVAAEEAEQREQLEKERVEQLKEIEKNEKEIVESMNRVYEHFKDTVQKIPQPDGIQDEVKESLEVKQSTTLHRKSDKRSNMMSLNEMRGRKRKRRPSIDEDTMPGTSQIDVSTSIPFLHKKIIQTCKKQDRGASRRKQARNSFDEHSGAVQQPHIQSEKPSFKPIRNCSKEEKKANKQHLKSKDMLPKQSFDYKNVDFGNFQGGSSKSNSVPYQSQNRKKHIRGNRGRGKGKQKSNHR